MRTELFDRGIPDAFSATRQLERCADKLVSGVSTSLLAKYLLDRSMAARIPRNNLPAAICYTLDQLLTHEKPKSDKQAPKLRRDYARSLSAAAATATQFSLKKMWLLVRCLEPSGTRDADLNWPRGLLRHVLTVAAYFGKVELVTKLIEERTIEVNGETYFGTPIQCAVTGGNCDITRLLLQHPSTNVDAALSDVAPLEFALEAGNEDMVHLLLKPRYPFTRMVLSISSFLTVIIGASRGGHQELIDVMKKSWTDYSSPLVSNIEHSILCEAAHCGHVNLVRIALDNGTSPNSSIKPSLESLPTRYAASRGPQ